jgi:N-glycosylase/DNA lyase
LNVIYNFDFSDELDQSNLEERLRKMNFGYRARYIQQAVKYLKYSINDSTFFEQLKSSPVKESRNQLLKIMGVGRKVT